MSTVQDQEIINKILDIGQLVDENLPDWFDRQRIALHLTLSEYNYLKNAIGSLNIGLTEEKARDVDRFLGFKIFIKSEDDEAWDQNNIGVY